MLSGSGLGLVGFLNVFRQIFDDAIGTFSHVAKKAFDDLLAGCPGCFFGL